MTNITISRELNQLLETAEKVVLIAHKHPDGDAVGSCLGLSELLRANGLKTVSIVNNDPIPENLLWLPGSEAWHSLEANGKETIRTLLDEADLFFFLDFNSAPRMGAELLALFEESYSQNPDRSTVMIDHHPSPNLDCTLSFSETFRSATAEVICGIWGLPQQMTSPIDSRAATNLLAAICTDTGLFAHNASRGELFEVVARLMSCGADKEEIILRIFHNDKIERQQLLGHILNKKIEYLPEMKAALFTLSLEELERFGLNESDLEGLVNFPLSARGIEISVFIRENLSDGIKISLRSERSWPVNQVAQQGFGGGGHRNAAGAEFSGTLEEAREIVIRELARLF